MFVFQHLDRSAFGGVSCGRKTDYRLNGSAGGTLGGYYAVLLQKISDASSPDYSLRSAFLYWMSFLKE